MGELQKIPGIGQIGEQDLIAIGYPTIASLRGADPEALYRLECERKGQIVDRCVLYVYRCAVYYANTPEGQRDSHLLKWWNWKDEIVSRETK